MARSHAPIGEEFVLHDGSLLHNLHELSEALARMSEQDFSSFVNAQKNDFAQWIEYSLDDKFLAAKVRKARARNTLRKTLFVTINR